MPNKLRVAVTRIVSGGQTGVDRGALDAAICLGIDHGGWCPRGRLSEDGTIPPRYALTETESKKYPVRTERNVSDSDGTLVLHAGTVQGGTQLTLRCAATYSKPVLVIDLSTAPDLEEAREWLKRNRIAVLNIAGPRESSSPGIADAAHNFVVALLQDHVDQANA